MLMSSCCPTPDNFDRLFVANVPLTTCSFGLRSSNDRLALRVERGGPHRIHVIVSYIGTVSSFVETSPLRTMQPTSTEAAVGSAPCELTATGAPLHSATLRCARWLP